MERMLAGFGLLTLLAGTAHSGPDTCTIEPCHHVVQFASVAEEKSYGLLLRAPNDGCRRARYRVETTGEALLGKTPALAAGEMAVVRIGRGFHPGVHDIVVIAEGCSKAPDLMRRVTFSKASPDYGWRAAPVLAVEPPTVTASVSLRPSFPWSQ
jgi:hypothetical protein